MKDSLLTQKSKKEIQKLIKEKKYRKVVSMLEKVKTSHAGTAKTKDKRYVIKEIVKNIIDNSRDRERDYFKTGCILCNMKEDIAKEIGISIIWRGYKIDTGKVKEFLLKVADDPNWEVREYAANAFADILYYNEDFYKTVMSWTKHRSENVRRAVVISSLGLREKKTLDKAFSILEPLMFDKSRYVRKNLGPFILGSYFGNKFPDETLKQLDTWSRIRDENVRWNIIMTFNNSFGNKHPVEAIRFLKKFTGDVDLTVKRAIVSTLRFLKKRHPLLVNAFIEKNKFTEALE